MEGEEALRLILSRKGFDSASGGCPSPIFPDGSMIALPIPDKTSPVRYQDLSWRGRNLGEVVEALTRMNKQRGFGAHLDPDLRPEMRPRSPGWRPVLGQHAAAQSHLNNQGVSAGDLFLFWGLFREVDGRLRWVGRPRHVIWGWLRVGAVVSVDQVVRPGISRGEWRWAADHPHLAFRPDAKNTLYVAADRLDPAGKAALGAPGAGVFDFYNERRQLSAVAAASPLEWSLPSWFRPGKRCALSYHSKPTRWVARGDRVLLRPVARGQEFVLHTDDYPEALGWVAELLRGGGSSLL